MAKAFYFVLQSWMLDDMDLSLAEAAVYAYIHGLTNSEELGKQGWHGSVRRLAKVLKTQERLLSEIRTILRLQQVKKSRFGDKE